MAALGHHRYASVSQDSEYPWIWLNNALWQGSKHPWSTFHRVLNKLPVLNMPRLRIWQGCKYARVTQGAEYALTMSQYAWLSLLTLNMIKYAGIYLKKQSAEYTRILNVSDAYIAYIRSLYKWLSSYRDRYVFRTLSNI